MTKYLDSDTIVNMVIQATGKTIVLATPLGNGKPNHLINVFYRRAVADPTIDLTICTALTLQRPAGASELEKRFINLFDERIFQDYPDLDYELARTKEALPENIKVIEFYFTPGKYLENKYAQKKYISSNYTHVVRDIMDRKVNVLAQMVSREAINGATHFSLSSNPDITIDLYNAMRSEGRPFVMIAQVNQNLPFMYGDALVKEDLFDFVVDDPKQYFTLFGAPKMSVELADYMIGLYCSTLVKDDGEIQIGIGAIGDATIYNLVMRQQQNNGYQQILQDLEVVEKFSPILERCGDTAPFEKGLFGASEMIVDGFMHLYQNQIVKKKVYDHAGLQRLLNDELITEKFADNILEVLWRNKLIHDPMSREEFDFLQEWGILRDDLTFDYGCVYTPDGQEIAPHLRDPASREFLKTHCLGTSLKNGQVMHGGFFLGAQDFYTWLRELPEEERKLINMKSVQKINQLYGHELLDRLHRKNARFLNTCMMYTLAGAAVSDGLEDGSVVSGVGGQYNFVAMAQELPDGHSILNLRSTRLKNGKVVSNILPFYGHITIPRHLRDIVVTEYGIAFLRGKTDEEIIRELLNVCDSRFQGQLLQWAKQKGKLDEGYEIPEKFRHNFPEAYQKVITKYQAEGLFPPFPFGTELNKEEVQLGKALKGLKADLEVKSQFFKTLLKSLFVSADDRQMKLLKLMKLDRPKSIREWLYKKLLTGKLKNEE